MHTWITIDSPADYEKLSDHLPSAFSASVVIERLRQHLSENVKGVLVEYPYVDKDYRSTYYAFYAKKGKRYDPFCVRLHFFSGRVRLTDDLSIESDSGNPSGDYFGYMVVRPTGITPIGRTVISIDAVKEFAGAVIDGKFVVHLLGHRLQVRGFPFMQQHTDISVCAHAACWGIVRHYSERYSHYAECLVYDITKMASTGDPGGLIPSRGLMIPQACQVFLQAGLYPDVYDREQFKENFDRILMAYIESGFPVFAAMNKQQHAISVIGHGVPDRQSLKPLTEVQYCWDATQSFYVVDDNLMPYQLVDGLDSAKYKVSDIDGFIVPLPDKIFFPAEAVERHIELVLKNRAFNLDLSHLNSPVARYFVTTSAALKRHFKESRTQFPVDLYMAVVELVLPQFVWVVELSSLTDWQNKRCNCLMILDATASAYDEAPYFVLTDATKAIIFDRAITGHVGIITFENAIGAMSEIRTNLTSRI